MCSDVSRAVCQLVAEFRAQNIGTIAPTVGAIPFALWFRGNLDAGEVEPFSLAVAVVACDHFAIGELVADAEALLVDGAAGRHVRPI